MVIVVGVTGGIAAYKSVQLVRLLIKDGHDVHVIPTEDALRFVGLPTWEAVSRNKVTTSVHDDVAQVRHVALGQEADLVVIAPATANTLAKMAAGMADNLLGTTLLSTHAPVVVAPAMHTEMWLHPATQANAATLASRGVHFIGPDSGELTGGDSGPGRMVEPEDIHASLKQFLESSTALAGVKVVVSAGGTREPVDPVRYIGNRSSGLQGIEVALAAADRGAEVTLVACNIESSLMAKLSGSRVTVERAGSASDLSEVMHRLSPSHDVVIMAAAVADYRLLEVSETKLSKEDSDEAPVWKLTRNEDILASLVDERIDGQLIVGFAAETPTDEADLLQRGIAKRQRKGCDLLAVNAVGWHQGFEAAENELFILGPDDTLSRRVAGSKRDTAEGLIDVIFEIRADSAD